MNRLRQVTQDQGDSIRGAYASGPDGFFETANLTGTLKQRSVRGGIYTLAAQIAKFVLHLASVIVLARLLLPSEFGLVAMVTPITGFISLFKDLGLSLATVQQEKVTHAQVSTLFWINVVVSAVLAVLCATISPLVAGFYADARTGWITLAVAGTFLLGGLTAQHQAILMRQMRFGALGIIDVCAMAMGIGTAIATAWLGWGYWALVAMMFATGITNMVAVWYASKWIPGAPRRGAGTRKMLRFGGGLTVFNVFAFLGVSVDKVIIGRMLGAQDLGIYTRAWALVLTPAAQVLYPVNEVLMPSLSRLKDSPDAYRRALRKALRLVLIAVTPLAALAVTTADSLVAILLGPQWSDVANVFPALSFMVMTIAALSLGNMVLRTTGRTDILARWGAINLVVTLIVVAGAAPFGLIAIAYAYSLTEVLLRKPILLFLVSRHTAVRVMDLLGPFLTYAPLLVLLVLIGHAVYISVPSTTAWVRIATVGVAQVAVHGLAVRAMRHHDVVLEVLQARRP